MLTSLIIFLVLLTVGITLLIDDIPGNDDVGEFFAGAGAMGALIISGIMLWGVSCC